MPDYVNDDFSIPQDGSNNNYEVNGLPGNLMPNPSNWKPVNSERFISQYSQTDSNTLNRPLGAPPGTNGYYMNKNQTDFFILSYIPITGYFDLSNLTSINISSYYFADSPPFHVDLSLSDSSNNTKGLPMGTSNSTNGFSLSWGMTNFSQLDLSQISSFTFSIETNGNGLKYETYYADLITRIYSIPVCVAKDTKILMADGTQKLVQDIKRGDIIADDPLIKNKNRVARLVTINLAPEQKFSFIKLEKNSLGKNVPNDTLILSYNHPILYKGYRVKAKAFRKFKGVKYYSNINAAQILPKDENNTYTLYNIQYEHRGFYVANGVTIESLPPNSALYTLPEDLYFNENITREIPPLVNKIPRDPKK